MQGAVMTFSRYLEVISAGVLLTVLGGCHVPQETGRLLYIDSHHPGDASSDAILAGMYEVVADSRARLDVFFLDARRYPQSEAIAAKIEEVLTIIGTIRPDVIIASGDNAVRSVVAEHLKDGPIPCVFCGIAGTAVPYGLSTENVTGILAMPPVAEAVLMLKPYYPGMKRVAVLSGGANQPSGLETVLRDSELTATAISTRTYGGWKRRFAEANARADVIFLATNQGIDDWDEADARAFVREHICVPVVTCDAAMMKYAVFGLVAAGREQGRWAAATALRIARGKEPSEIRIARTQQTTAYLSRSLAECIGFEPNEELLNRCRRVE